MFDLNATDGSVRKKPYESPIPDTPSPDEGDFEGHEYDHPAVVTLFRQTVDQYIRELDRQRDNRAEMAQDADFYDNIQWSEEDAAILEERGQTPLVYNIISASIDWVLGTQRRTRTDFKVLPRRKEDGKPAERKTQLLKYLSDVNRTPFDVSRAFADAVKVGIGWMDDGVQSDGEEEPIYARYESWRNVIYDSTATRLDVEDGRYQFRGKWVDEDVACAFFPDRKDLVRRSVSAADDFYSYDRFCDEAMDSQEIASQSSGLGSTHDRQYGYQRRRLRIVEGWLKIPRKVQRIKGGAFDREIFDRYSPGHVDQVRSGAATLATAMTMRVHPMLFTPIGVLWFGESPYRHNRFPLTPIWGKRRDRDGLPYGMTRNLKGIQDDVNKRAAKSLAILSSNKVIMEEGAVDDLDAFAEEVSRPDAIIVKKAGKELELNADRDLSQYHDQHMSRSIALIQSASGVTDENLGRRTNAVSGIAIARRQDQGSLATSLYFDNLWLASQIRGEKQLSLVEQFVSEQKAFRITNMRGTPEFINVNDGLPENDIIRSKADFLISEADWMATQRQAAVEQLLETMSKMPPEIAMVFLDLAIENMDLPNGEEIVKRIRQVTGMPDPDADEPSPEDQAKAAEAAEAKKVQIATIAANLRKLLAEAEEAEAKADQAKADTIGKRVSAQAAALAAARDALAMPAAAHVADHILTESGYQPSPPQIDGNAQPKGLGLPPPPNMPTSAPAPAGVLPAQP